jgi:hypothetical protein
MSYVTRFFFFSVSADGTKREDKTTKNKYPSGEVDLASIIQFFSIVIIIINQQGNRLFCNYL